MRIARLVAAGHNGSRGSSTGAQNRRINFRPENFRRERFPRPKQSLSAADFRRLQNFNTARESGLGDSQRPAHHLDFLVRFRFALRPKRSIRRVQPDFVRGQFARITERKIRGDDRRFYAALVEKMRKDFFVGRRLFRFSLHFAFEFAKGNEFVRVSLLARTIDFQIAQDQRAFAVSLKKNKRIGRPELRRVQHVGVMLARRYDQAIFSFGFCSHPRSAIHLRSVAMLVIPRSPRRPRDLTLARCRFFSAKRVARKRSFLMRDSSTSLGMTDATACRCHARSLR